MKIKKDFTYCYGNSSIKCKKCARLLDLKYKDIVIWRMLPNENCEEFIKKD